MQQEKICYTKKMAECPICMDADMDVELSCGHCFCSRCLHLHMEKSSVCPLCRQTIVSTSEFVPGLSHTVVSVEDHVGITVGDARDGVRVIRVELGDQAHVAGIRKGDIINRINGLKCSGHAPTIARIETASRLNMKKLYFDVSRRKKCTLLW